MKQMIRAFLLAGALACTPTLLHAVDSPPSKQGAVCERTSKAKIKNLEDQLVSMGVSIWRVFGIYDPTIVNSLWREIANISGIELPWDIGQSEVPNETHIIVAQGIDRAMILAAKDGCHLGGVAWPSELLGFLPLDIFKSN